jgi:Fe-coproporphyrin III synthase
MIDITRLYCGIDFESQTLRYGKEFEGGKFTKPKSARERKPIVVWNITRTCNLKCVHCYSDSEAKSYEGELNTYEAKKVIDDLAEYKIPALLFSGGEPLVRKDLFELVEYAKSKGLRTVLSSNGTLINEETARKIKQVGFSYVGISIDGIQEKHDFFRGVKGAFEKAINGIRFLKQYNQKVGLRLTLTKYNIEDLPAIFDLILSEGINRVCFYHLVPAGRGKELAELTPALTRSAIDYILWRTKEIIKNGVKLEVLTVDNHVDGAYIYLKLLHENPQRAKEVYQLLEWNGGGLYSSGVGIGCIDFYGNVHPDQFWMHYNLGNVKNRPFSEIWEDISDPLLFKLKNKKEHLKGKCRACRFLNICGGALRTRAQLLTGDPFAPDPLCYLTEEEIGLKS